MREKYRPRLKERLVTITMVIPKEVALIGRRQCPRCRYPVALVKRRGRRTYLNPDGTPHGPTCVGSARMRSLSCLLTLAGGRRRGRMDPGYSEIPGASAGQSTDSTPGTRGKGRSTHEPGRGRDGRCGHR